jgi:ketosteroid isomerase-like protein
MPDPSSITAGEAAVHDQLARINDAWQHLHGDAMTAALNACFAEDVVIRGPNFAFISKGRPFAVQSYQDFVAQSEVKAFAAEDAAIDISGDTAIATYAWQMTYTLAGQEYTEQGHDLFVFSKKAEGWLVIWRTLLFS